MIIGLGSDICDIRRIEAAIVRHGDRFLSRVFTDAERAKDQDWCPDAGLAQGDPLFDIGAREHRRTGVLERERHLAGPVSIRVGLDHGDDPRRGPDPVFAIPAQIGA